MNEKVAIIGCGQICLVHGYPIAYRKDVDLVAVCDIVEEKARNIADILKCKKYYTDYLQMFEQEKIDIVHICTPHYLHPVMAREAMKRKIHVITEKPMAIHYDDAVDLVKTAQKVNVKFEAVMQNRFNAASQLVKKTLQSGELGEIISAKALLMWNRDKAYYDKSDWKGTWDKEGGGVVIDQAIHTLDLLRWFVDKPVESVEATLYNRVHHFIEVEDTADGIIAFKGGLLASFYFINYYGYDAPIEIELFCENGIIKVIGSRAEILFNDNKKYIADIDEKEKEKFGPFNKCCWGISHIKQINSFYSYIRNEEEQYIKIEDALETQKLVCAIYESNKQKSKLNFNSLK